MESNEDLNTARVIVRFHSSSTKDGKEAYQVTVLAGATEDEAEQAMKMAKKLRAEALEALKPPSLEEHS